MFVNPYLVLVILISICLVESLNFTKANLRNIKLKQGDILVSPNDTKTLRNGFLDLGKRWPSGQVYYLFLTEENYPTHGKSIIRQAMNYIEESTCIKFIELVRILCFYYPS